MSKRGKVFVFNKFAGLIEETDEGQYVFTYDKEYLAKKSPPVSLTLPLKKEPYTSELLFPFFDNLIPEGWLLHLTTNNWKINPKDRMGLLLNACGDCIGAVHVVPDETSKE